MKIAINGSIIETETIYEITPIECGDWVIVFLIKMFNTQQLITVKMDISFNSRDSKYFVWYKGGRNKNFDNYEDARQFAITRIENIRNEIIALWSNNQSTIPQINY